MDLKPSILYGLLTLWLAFSCSPKPGGGQKAAGQTGEETTPLMDKAGEETAEVEEEGYPAGFSSSSANYAIVLKPDLGFVAVNKAGEIMYKVFLYDNGPDYPADGYFRIVETGKIGYADVETGEIRIHPQYAAARPFENGYAAVCPDCETKTDGEYSSWVNGKWGLIDKNGEVVIQPQFEEIREVAEGGRVLVTKGGQQKWVEIE